MEIDINVSKLKDEVNKYNRLVESFEDTYLNYYNEINNSTTYWTDGISIKFFDNCNKERLQIKKNITELKDINSVYKYIVSSYEALGQRVAANLSNRNNINQNFINIINKINDIVNSYNRLDLSGIDGSVISMINSEKRILLSNKVLLEQQQNVINNYFDKIEAIEREINLRLSRINISYIEEIAINDIIGEDN